MKNKIRYITDAANAPTPIGPYSQATMAGNMVFLSGQVPIDPATGKIVDGGVEAQAEQVMKNLRAVLNHLELDFANVMKTNIFLTDLSNFKVVNAIYEKWVGANKPARSTIQISALPLGAQVEIEMVAICDG